MTPIKILHFADAHIDACLNGRRDPQKGLPIHALDFLRSLDTIVETAIAEKAQLVLFAGDAFRNAIPVPTYQREWGRRMMALSNAGIPVVLIGGNHDISPALGRASALHEIETYQVPKLFLARGIHLYGPEELGVPVQVLTIPWFSSAIFRGQAQSLEPADDTDTDDVHTGGKDFNRICQEIITENAVNEMVKADPELPLILLAHYPIEGIQYVNHQDSSLEKEICLPKAFLKNPDFSYVALGHIHQFQDLNEGEQPPVVYSGSIERVNYGEAKDEKGFIIANVEPHHTEYEFRRLDVRPMINRVIQAESGVTMTEDILNALPSKEDCRDAMISVDVIYPHEWGTALDEQVLRDHTAEALEFRLQRRPQFGVRSRVSSEEKLTARSPEELLELYCNIQEYDLEEIYAMKDLAREIIGTDESLS